MATNIGNGILLCRPTQFNANVATFETELVDRFFVGRKHPIDFSQDFQKYLKSEYDIDEADIVIDLFSESNEFDDKPGTVSFDLLLDYLIEQQKRTKKGLRELIHGASIVCRRGVLSKLVDTPYNDCSEFRLAVKRFNGIYFIKEMSTDTYIKRDKKRPDNPHAFLPKFKKHIIAPYGNDSYTPPIKLSTWEQMQGLYLCDLKSDSKYLKIFYGTEIDAFDKDDKIVEIKLQNGELSVRNNRYWLANKLRKWYFQTRFGGTEQLLVGVRNEKFITSMKKIHVDTLSSRVKPEKRWHDDTSYSAMAKILSTVCEFYENNIKENQTLRVELSKKEKSNVLYIVCEDNIYPVLPSKFIEAFEEEITVVTENVDADDLDQERNIFETDNDWLDNIVEKAFKI